MATSSEITRGCTHGHGWKAKSGGTHNCVLCINSTSKLARLTKDAGSAPDKGLSLRLSHCKLVRLPNLGGSDPENSL